MSGLSIYKILFVAELVIAEGLFLFRMPRRKKFVIRFIAALLVCFAAALFFPVSGSFAYNGWYVSLMFLVLFLISVGGIMFIFDISLMNVIFCAVAAYTAQHLAYEIFKLACTPFDMFWAQDMYSSDMIDITSFSGETVTAAFVYFDIYLAVYAAVYFLLAKKIPKSGELQLKRTSLLALAAVMLLVDIVLNAVIVYVDTDYNKIYDIVVCIYNCLSCVLVFFIQNNLILVKDMREELDAVSHMLQQAEKQYTMRKEEIDLINIKCHDLKHQIGRFADSGGFDKETVQEIERMISIYDTAVKTGNEVLDIILTEKSLICQSKKIRLSCMADGNSLAFVSNGDLYALFGNIVDNAIEAASEVIEEGKRCISLNVHAAGGAVSVMAENYYAGMLRFSADGLPETTKTNSRNNHGYGLKSVRLIAEKYGGNMSVVAKDGIFRLNVILFPPNKK